MFTFSKNQVIILTIVIGLITGVFGYLIGMKTQPKETVAPAFDPALHPPILPDEMFPPGIGEFEQLWLDGEVVRVNPEENYLIVKTAFRADHKEIKIILTPETKIERSKIVEQTIQDFKPGDFVTLESKEDIRDKTETSKIRMIQIVSSSPEPVFAPAP